MKTKIKQVLAGVIALVAAGVMSSSAWAGATPKPTITAVEAQQRLSGDNEGKVEITVTFEGQENDVAGLNCVFYATTNDVPLKATSVTMGSTLEGSGSVWTQTYIWDAKADLGDTVQIPEVALKVEAAPGVQLWKDGPYWAVRNVGANKSTDYGYYLRLRA